MINEGFRHIMTTKKPKHNTDGLVKCLPQPGQLRNQP
jgi:hypothetical protein